MKSTELKKSFDDAINSLVDAIESEEVTQELRDFYKQASRFTKYSLSNQLLIMRQDPKATQVAGYKAWMTKFSRYVMKGETGIRILAPHMYKAKDDDGKVSEHVGFHTTTVFDVKQTDGEPLLDPTCVAGDNGAELYATLVAYNETIGMTVSIEDLGDIDGICRKDSIGIRSRLSTQSKVGVLIHETAHKLCGHHGSDTPKAIKEYEAETVSYIVCERFGIENKAPQYLKNWGMTRDNIKDSLKIVSTIASKIINAIDKPEKEEQ